jgi:hypothetical protein
MSRGHSHPGSSTLTSSIFAVVIAHSVAVVKAQRFHLPLQSFRTTAQYFLILHCSLRC